jgi:hypothetical protein
VADSIRPAINYFGFSSDSLAATLKNALPLSLWVINDLKIFGPYEDSLISPDTDSLFLRMYESTINRIAIEANEKPYTIWNKFSFTDLPCIKMYLLNFYAGAEKIREKYSCALLNICDSTIYVYGGNVGDFNNVIRRYLPEIVEKRRFTDLINLYINSFSILDRHVIISDTNDYKAVWESEIKREPKFLQDQYRRDYQPQIKREMKLLKGKLRRVGYSFVNDKKPNYYIVGLCTWEYDYGKIEEWSFHISDNVFEVYRIKPIAINMGPWRILHRHP